MDALNRLTHQGAIRNRTGGITFLLTGGEAQKVTDRQARTGRPYDNMGAAARANDGSYSLLADKSPHERLRL